MNTPAAVPSPDVTITNSLAAHVRGNSVFVGEFGQTRTDDSSPPLSSECR